MCSNLAVFAAVESGFSFGLAPRRKTPMAMGSPLRLEHFHFKIFKRNGRFFLQKRERSGMKIASEEIRTFAVKA
jgi:hypothetical protein